jgi:beta-lactamase superfamily II metal-dependent hydrolase
MHHDPRSLPRSLRRAVGVALALVLLPAAAHAISGNGKLQVHHIDVGQGDGALLISPNGQTALFDDGNYLNCSVIKSYLQGLGIATVDYHFLSHYHSDHLGCIDDLAAIGITIGTTGFDRGYSYSSGTYTAYVNTLGPKRQTMAKNQVVTLDAGSPNPVTIKCVDLNGAGVYSPSGSDENAKSMALLVSYGSFQEEISGDLTGDPPSGNDVESTIGPEVGNVDVYKIHHHGSRYSTNENWLNAVTPEVCIVSCGDGNSYGHPTTDALNRLHAHGVHTYWTETGAGATPNPSWDKVAHGTIVIQANPGAGASYTITGPGINDTWFNDGGAPPIHTQEFPSSLTMLKGSLATGDVTRLAVSDDSRIGVSAGVSAGNYYTDWYASVFLAHPPLNLTVTYEGSFTVSRTQTLYVWNWSTSAWVQVNSATVSTTDVTKTWSTGSPASYVGPSREVRFRVKGDNRASTYTSRGDYMAFDYDYTAGTVTSPTHEAVVVASAIPVDDSPLLALAGLLDDPYADHDLALAGAPGSVVPSASGEFREAPQAVLERVEASRELGGTRLEWAVNAKDHIDGFNVYRETADGAMVFAGNESAITLEGGDAIFRFLDASGAHAGVYWLGVRSCSGPEALVGPIPVAPVAAAASLEMTLGPNPTASATRIAFRLEHDADVKLELFDLQGRQIGTLLETRMPAGPVQATWNLRDRSGRTVEPGLYFARLQALGRVVLTRVTVVSP